MGLPDGTRDIEMGFSDFTRTRGRFDTAPTPDTPLTPTIIRLLFFPLYWPARIERGNDFPDFYGTNLRGRHASTRHYGGFPRIRWGATLLRNGGADRR